MKVVPPSWKAGAKFVTSCAEDTFNIADAAVLDLLVDCVRDDNDCRLNAEQIEALDFAIVKALLDEAQELMTKKNSVTSNVLPLPSAKELG